MNFFHPLARLARQRKKSLKTNIPRVLLPLVDQSKWYRHAKLSDIELLALDFETSGLDVSRDSILSMGWVVVSQGLIKLDSAYRINVATHGLIKPETAVINHIVCEQGKQTEAIKKAVQKLIDEMTGRVIVAHCAPIERGFFHQYCKREFGVSSIAMLWLDTLQIEKSLSRGLTENWQADYQLSSVRDNYGLPRYPGHDSLVDALATAELFLAQVKSVFGNSEAYLGPMVERS